MTYKANFIGFVDTCDKASQRIFSDFLLGQNNSGAWRYAIIWLYDEYSSIRVETEKKAWRTN